MKNEITQGALTERKKSIKEIGLIQERKAVPGGGKYLKKDEGKRSMAADVDQPHLQKMLDKS